MQPTKPGAPRSAPPPPAAGKARLGVRVRLLLQAPAVVALAAVLAVASPPQQPPPAPPQQAADESSSTLCHVPPTLSGDDKQPERIKHPSSPQAARCTSKCVSICVLGGAGIGGPFNVRSPLVVFKDSFHSQQYCLVECSDICNLIKDGEDGQ